MKKQIVKSVLCLALSATMIMGEAVTALAATAEKSDTEVGAVADTAAAEEESGAADTKTDVTDEANVPEVSSETDAADKEAADTQTLPEVAETESSEPANEVENTSEAPKTEDAVDPLGAKVVAFTSLDPVTGIVYRASDKLLSWNTVTHATSYNLTITNTQTNEVKNVTVQNPYYTLDGLEDNVAYTVSIIAYDGNDYYLAAANIPKADLENKESPYYHEKFDYYTWCDTLQTAANLYNHPVSSVAGVAGPFVVSTSSDVAITQLPGISRTERLVNKITFQVNTPPLLADNEYISWEYSNSPDFTDNAAKDLFVNKKTFDSAYTALDIDLSEFVPSETCYVRARVYNEDIKVPYTNADGSTGYNSGAYGPYTGVATYGVPRSEIDHVETSVTDSSITLAPIMAAGSATGFQFQKKVGKKWMDLGVQTDATYKDSKLEKNKKYSYRVRSYSYNPKTGRNVQSFWYKVSATTWGSNLNLKGTLNNKSKAESVKLTWNKVNDADGYEVYRMESDSYNTITSEGILTNDFTNYTLIKTLKKSKTTKYVDEKLDYGRSYTYYIRAYRTSGKEKSYINSNEVTVNLKADTSIRMENSYYTSDGKLTVKWAKDWLTIEGYEIVKKDPATGQFVSFDKLNKKATSYTFPKVEAGNPSVEYRIRPYYGKKKYYGITCTVQPMLGAVKNVKATVTEDGIQVSWSPVSGASYYRVFRTTDSDTVYNKTTKTYSARGNLTTVYEAMLDASNCDPSRGGRSYNAAGTNRTDKITATSVMDRTITYKTRATDSDGNDIIVGKDAQGNNVYQTEDAIYNQGARKGATYYYYVQAVANPANGQASYDDSKDGKAYSAGFKKPASVTYTDKTVGKVREITSAKSKKKSEATITYKKASNASGYAIYRATSKKGTYVLVGTTQETSFTDRELKSGKTYYYKVAAYTKTESQSYLYSAKTGYKQVKIK